MILTKDGILAADDLKRELVSVPEWGGDVYVRVITGDELGGFQAMFLEAKGADRSENMSRMIADLCALTLCDETGLRLFATSEMRTLGAKSASALNRVFAVSLRLNGLNKDDVDELAGN